MVAGAIVEEEVLAEADQVVAGDLEAVEVLPALGKTKEIFI